ncbi:MAG TPA: response regulator transcription factor [Opitutaceae bacterium]|nr:response regulator transcription factor [Opitutaceae bacterium]
MTTSAHEPIRVSIVEDHHGTRHSLTALIRGEARLHFVEAYSSGEAAVRGVPAAVPDVLLVDINLPGMSGIDCVARLRVLVPQVQVLILTTYEEPDAIFNSLRAGAKGYLLKKMVPDELIQAVEQVHAGGAPLSMEIARKVVDHFDAATRPESPMEKLSHREQSVLALLAQGHLYKEIADALEISLHTVQGHVKHIYSKLEVRSRAGATMKFLGRS